MRFDPKNNIGAESLLLPTPQKMVERSFNALEIGFTGTSSSVSYFYEKVVS